jgi:ribonuclease HI
LNAPQNPTPITNKQNTILTKEFMNQSTPTQLELIDAPITTVPSSEQHVNAWTDGACKGNPGVGGWGVLLNTLGQERTLCGGEAHTTNNRMEMMAVLKALEAVEPDTRIILHTDSQYVHKGMTEWLPNWKRRQWKTADRKPVKNADLWQALDVLVAQRQVQWRWVRGHAGDVGNERADQLANQGVLKALQTK